VTLSERGTGILEAIPGYTLPANLYRMVNLTEPKGTRSTGERAGKITQAPASSEYCSRAAIEPFVRNIGASCFASKVLETCERIFTTDYPKCKFPDFLHSKFDYYYCKAATLVAGWKKLTEAEEVSGR